MHARKRYIKVNNLVEKNEKGRAWHNCSSSTCKAKAALAKGQEREVGEMA